MHPAISHPATWAFPLVEKRDALLARQRARQLAALLGFDFLQQACVSAGVFAVAWQVLESRAPVELCFQIDATTLQVYAQPILGKLGPKKDKGKSTQRLWRLEKKLPYPEKGLTSEDLAFVLGQLNALTPAQLYEEVFRQNQELLAALSALQTFQSNTSRREPESRDPSAA